MFMLLCFGGISTLFSVYFLMFSWAMSGISFSVYIILVDTCLIKCISFPNTSQTTLAVSNRTAPICNHYFRPESLTQCSLC